MGRKCIYCRVEKAIEQFTLEHVVPRFLGGACMPDAFKVNDVCGSCNSNLGLFVDAGFEKNWIISNWLSSASRMFYDPASSSGVSLVCMGEVDFSLPFLDDGNICELWLGTLGEQVYWVRPKDDRLYWYSGGNPRTVKKVETVAYFFFSEKYHVNPKASWLSFKGAFEGRNVKKVIGAEIDGVDFPYGGFSAPDVTDVARIKYFRNEVFSKKGRECKAAFYIDYDLRFMAKLSIGFAYALFGKDALEGEYVESLYKALWHRPSDDLPGVRGSSHFSVQSDKQLEEFFGVLGAVTVLLTASSEGVILGLNIGGHVYVSMLCVSFEDVSQEGWVYGEGMVFILFKDLHEGLSLTLGEYIAHKTGVKINLKLKEISDRVNKYEHLLRG